LKLCPELQRGLADEDAVPEPADCIVSRLGEMWILGPHLLLCSDSAELPTIKRLLAGQEAAMSFTDPPYSVAYEGGQKTEDS
jgi:hypothetical protein